MNIIKIIPFVFIAACATQQQMDATPPQRTVAVAENYQAVYARLNKQMRTCYWDLKVDGQLYADLGYGEIAVSGGVVPFDHVKVSRDGSGANVEIKSLMKSIWEKNNSRIDDIEYWAKGGNQCP